MLIKLTVLAKANCLRKEEDFKKLARSRSKVKEEFLLLKCAQNNFNQTRVGISVSKKISKKATVRNKIKRRLREAVKLRLTEIKKGTDFLLIVTPGAENKNFAEISNAVNRLFERAGFLEKKT